MLKSLINRNKNIKSTMTQYFTSTSAAIITYVEDAEEFEVSYIFMEM
jgi:hypothetical protein